MLGIKPTIDFVFKRLFGSPENVKILIGLLNAILRLRRPIEQVEIVNPFSFQEFADDKLVVLDIRARDIAGRWLNIEMQVSAVAGLLNRIVYYVCTMYADQLESGEDYVRLRPSISICLLGHVLFRDDAAPHHRFRLADPEHECEIPDSIEVHTVEFPKYDLSEATIRDASEIEQWSFFFLYANSYEAARLRELLPGVEFQNAITVIETIAAKTEDRMMYDQREKAERDAQWRLNSARDEGLKQGRAEQIQLLQQLLGEEASSLPSLLQQSIDELAAQLTDLQQTLRSRSST
ncbi:MAG: Rpn family recombination-promoting nuclease/putative transposase [Planctomycetota bacterium]|nr:Rpn family recombination-promoting nuclease/putative transposase [Planctomycetota bacterium]